MGFYCFCAGDCRIEQAKTASAKISLKNHNIKLRAKLRWAIIIWFGGMDVDRRCNKEIRSFRMLDMRTSIKNLVDRIRNLNGSVKKTQKRTSNDQNGQNQDISAFWTLLQLVL